MGGEEDKHYFTVETLIKYLKQYPPDTAINLTQLNTLSYLTKISECVNMDTNKMELVFECEKLKILPLEDYKKQRSKTK